MHKTVKPLLNRLFHLLRLSTIAFWSIFLDAYANPTNPNDSDYDPYYVERVYAAFLNPEAVLAGHDPMNGCTHVPDPMEAGQTAAVALGNVRSQREEGRTHSTASSFPNVQGATTTNESYLRSKGIVDICTAFAHFLDKKEHKYDEAQFLINIHGEYSRVAKIIETAPPARWKELIDDGRGKGKGLYTVGNSDREKYNYQRSRINTFYLKIYDALGLPKELEK